MRRTAAKIVVAWAALSNAIPAVGGYSNTTPHRDLKTRWSSDFTSVGIVTQVSGGAFSIKSERDGAVRKLEVGDGLLKGQQLWVESGGLVRFTTPKGSAVTVSGPGRATLGLDELRVATGVVRFKAASGHALTFDHPVMTGRVEGECAIWASRDQVQVLALSGKNEVWHPALASAKLKVPPGFYSETSSKFAFLAPTAPKRVSEKSYDSFVARFDDDIEAELPENVASLWPHEPSSSKGRAIASAEPSDGFVGTRTSRDVTEEKSEAILSHLKARYSGLDVEEVGRPPLTVDPFARQSKKSRSVASVGGLDESDQKSAVRIRRVEVKKSKRTLLDQHEREHRAFIKKLEQSF